MKNRLLIDLPLWSLVAFGLYSVAQVSIDNFNGNECPGVGGIAICYVLTAAYAAMFLGVVFNTSRVGFHLFYVAWVIATTIGFLASAAQAFSSEPICPTTSLSIFNSGSLLIPLCYISLLILIVIGVLFVQRLRANE